MSEDHLSRLKALKLYGMAETWSELRAETGRQPVSNEGMLLKLLDAERAD